MSDDLLAQAKRLCKLDANKPKQANLRRAVSSSYYALFHFLCDQACRMAMGTQHSQAPYRHVLMRAFSHIQIRVACNAFAGGTLSASVSRALPTHQILPAVKQIASAYIELYDQRAIADYDLSRSFARSDVWVLIRQTETAIKQFKRLETTDGKKFFLACLWAYSALANRRG